MISKYRGIVEVDPATPQEDGKALVWDSATEMHVYADAVGGGISGYVATAPKANGLPIVNLYFDPQTNKIVGEYDDAGGASGTIASTPPSGAYPIINIYFDPVSGRLTGEYDDA